MRIDNSSQSSPTLLSRRQTKSWTPEALWEWWARSCRHQMSCMTAKNDMVLSWYFLEETGKREPARDETRNACPQDDSSRIIFRARQAISSAVPETKNHQGGLPDAEDESDVKILSAPDHPRCPVKTIKNYLSHLNPKLDALFQQSVVLQRTTRTEHFRHHDEINEFSRQNLATPDKSLLQGNISNSTIWQQLWDILYCFKSVQLWLMEFS